MQVNEGWQSTAKGGIYDGVTEILLRRSGRMIGRVIYCGNYGGLEMVSQPGGTDTGLHQRRHWLGVATERKNTYLAQSESNKKGILETVDGVPVPEKKNVRAIVSEEMKGTKEMVACGKQRHGGRWWVETVQI